MEMKKGSKGPKYVVKKYKNGLMLYDTITNKKYFQCSNIGFSVGDIVGEQAMYMSNGIMYRNR
jgi:hypothetical protein